MSNIKEHNDYSVHCSCGYDGLFKSYEEASEETKNHTTCQRWIIGQKVAEMDLPKDIHHTSTGCYIKGDIDG